MFFLIAIYSNYYVGNFPNMHRPRKLLRNKGSGFNPVDYRISDAGTMYRTTV